jgi:hypothetical protein
VNLKTKPRNSFVPFIVDVYDADQPDGSPRVVARCDTRSGQIWRTKGSNSKASMRDIRAALGR